MALPGTKGFGHYVKRALVEKWNLGLFLSALGFAAISPFPDALLPIVVGLEGLFVLGMAGNPRFRQAMDAQAAKATREPEDGSSQAFLRLLNQLSPADRGRFRQLVMHCEQMQSLAAGAQGGALSPDEARSSALNRLLFLYLQLLATRDSLRSFLDQSNLGELQGKRERVREQLTAAVSANDERLRASLADTLADLETRIANVEKGLKDAEYLDVELQRLEGKAKAVAEGAITRQDPTELSAQVTAFAETLKLSEDVQARMVSLQGLELATSDAPQIMNSSAIRIGA